MPVAGESVPYGAGVADENDACWALFQTSAPQIA